MQVVTIEEILLVIALIITLSIVIQMVFLAIGLRLVNGSNREFVSIFITVLVISILIVIPCLGCVLSWYVIKSRHDLGWGGAFASWIGGAIVQLITLILIMLVFLLPILMAVFEIAIPAIFPPYP
jgi:hypothetical protein